MYQNHEVVQLSFEATCFTQQSSTLLLGVATICGGLQEMYRRNNIAY